MTNTSTHIPSVIGTFEGKGFHVAQFKTPQLSIFSYYLQSRGKAVFIDPPVDLEALQKYAEERKAVIQGIIHTHFHADFIAGNLNQNVNIYLGQGSSSKVTSFKVNQLKNGHIFKVGDVTLKSIHTPGHTPESTCFLLSDQDGKDEAIFTGDTIFLGQVGRPDLATSQNVTQQELAAHLFDSVQKIKILKPNIRIYPAHGSGSSCGKKIQEGNYCTLQKQLQTNYALKVQSKNDFIKAILEGLGTPPQYYFHDATKNKNELTNYQKQFSEASKELTVEQFLNLSKTNTVIDIRDTVEEVGKGYIKGAYQFAEGGMLANWTGAIVSPKFSLLIFALNKTKADDAIRRLLRIGYRILGHNGFTIDEWKSNGGQITIPVYSKPQDLKKNVDKVVVDVRNQNEWKDTGIIEGALTIPLTQLEKNIDKIPKDKQVFVHCRAGYRGRAGASILQRHGIQGKSIPVKIQQLFAVAQSTPYKA